MSAADCSTREPDALVVAVYTQPRAGRSGITGLHDGALKVRVVAPPLDGRANAEVLAVLAAAFGVSPSRVELVAGETSRRKRVRIRGDVDALGKRLDEILTESDRG